MRSIRVARAVLLVFLVLFAGILGVAVWRSPPPAPVVPPPRTVPPVPADVQVEGPVESATETFLFTEERGGVIVTRLQAGRMLGIEGGHRVLSDILIEFRPEPLTHPERLARVKGTTGRFDATAHEVILGGEVVLQLATGEELHAPSLAYRLDERVARTDGAVRFTLEGLEGTARGLMARLQEQVVELQSQVSVSRPQGQGESLALEAGSLRHDGRGRSTRLGAPVTLRGDWGVFTGGDLALDPVAGAGTRATTAGPGRLRTAAGAGQVDVAAGAWEFHLDDGHGLRQAIASGQVRVVPAGEERSLPLETLEAARLRLRPGPGGLQMEAEGSGDAPVAARLSHPLVESVHSRHLRVQPAPGGEREILFTGEVAARGPGRAASGASLLARADRTARLLGVPGAPARLVQEGHVVTAAEILLQPDGGIEALDDVRIDVEPEPAGERGRLAAVAHRVRYAADTRTLRLDGQVRAWQGEDSLETAWLILEQADARILAGGGVATSLRVGEDGGVARASDRVQVRAQEMEWQRSTDQVRFRGQVRMLQGAAVVHADELQLSTGSPAERAYQALGQVRFQDPLWEGSGDRLAYQVDGPGYLLESQTGLARVTSRESGSTLTGRALRVDPTGEAMRVDSREGGRVTVRAGASGSGQP